jgi:putative transposase
MQRRLAVAHVVGLAMCGVKRAARVLGVARSSCYRSPTLMAQRASSEALLIQVSREHPTLGARKVAALLSLEHGAVVNHKRAARLRRVHGLRASRRGHKRRRLVGGATVRRVAGQPDEVWSYDFIEDATVDGRKVRLLSIIDEFSRECLLLEAARSFPAVRVIDCLERLLMTTGRCPQHLRSDNGPEFVAKAVQQWLEQAGVQSACIEPGSPWQNGHVESFHASLRSELLDRELFFDLREVQTLADDWRTFYNHRRPHGSLGYHPPVRHQKQAALRACATLQPFTPLASGQQSQSPLNPQPIAAD